MNALCPASIESLPGVMLGVVAMTVIAPLAAAGVVAVGGFVRSPGGRSCTSMASRRRSFPRCP